MSQLSTTDQITALAARLPESERQRMLLFGLELERRLKGKREKRQKRFVRPVVDFAVLSGD